MVKQVKHPGGHLRNRTVVKREIHHLATLALYAPYPLRKEDTVQKRRSFDILKHYCRLSDNLFQGLTAGLGSTFEISREIDTLALKLLHQ